MCTFKATCPWSPTGGPTVNIQFFTSNFPLTTGVRSELCDISGVCRLFLTTPTMNWFSICTVIFHIRHICILRLNNSAAESYQRKVNLDNTNPDVVLDNHRICTHGLDKHDFKPVLLWKDVVQPPTSFTSAIGRIIHLHTKSQTNAVTLNTQK